MGSHSIISIVIILGGAAVMLVNVLYSLNSFKIFKESEEDKLSKLSYFTTVHLVLMIFFLLGYFAVAWAIYNEVDVISDFFVSIIFFFGAIFVFLGTRLQRTMNAILRSHYQVARQAADDLKNEQEELLKTNTVLGLEIKERKQAEIIAREREQRLSQIMRSLPIGILIVDAETLIIKEVNPKAESLIGNKKEEIIGCLCQTYVFGASRNSCPMLNHPEKRTHQDEHLLIQAGGTEKAVLKTVSRIDFDGKPHFLEAFIDISEQKKLEEQLRQSQKMELLGTLAGGVAHDLNNILSGLLSYPELLLMGIDKSDPLRKPLETVKRSGEKAAVIVQDLLTLARQNVAVKEPVNLKSVVQEFLTSPEFEELSARHSRVKVSTSIDKKIKLTEGSSVHLSKVVMNLVSNAVEAISDEGNVQIILDNRYLDSPIPGYDTIAEGNYILLTVKDDGSGISPDDISKIFEPFYSSKTLGHSGSGLGMAIVWNTVKDHRGYIEVESIQDVGSSFNVYLPATDRLLADRDILVNENFPQGHGQSVLVVDDVEEQREIGTSILEYLNYKVEVAASGEAAVEMIREKQFDLVLLDMIMEQGMDGIETYKKITSLKPDQKILLVSGCSPPEHLDSFESIGLDNYIKKPYSLNVLAEKIHAELHHSGN